VSECYLVGRHGAQARRAGDDPFTCLRALRDIFSAFSSNTVKSILIAGGRGVSLARTSLRTSTAGEPLRRGITGRATS